MKIGSTDPDKVIRVFGEVTDEFALGFVCNGSELAAPLLADTACIEPGKLLIHELERNISGFRFGDRLGANSSLAHEFSFVTAGKVVPFETSAPYFSAVFSTAPVVRLMLAPVRVLVIGSIGPGKFAFGLLVVRSDPE